MAVEADQKQLDELLQKEEETIEEEREKRKDPNFTPAPGAGLVPEEKWQELGKEGQNE